MARRDPQLPASDAKLADCVAAALDCLDAWCRDSGRSREDRDPHPTMWRVILFATQTSLSRGERVAPLLRRQDVGIPARVELTGRQWERFLRWYRRDFEPDYLRKLQQRRLPPIFPARLSRPRGGYPDHAEAFYFISFDPPPTGPESDNSASELAPDTSASGLLRTAAGAAIAAAVAWLAFKSRRRS
jgi:hypothetical protein